MICPRCSVAEISPETNRCVLCGYSAGAAAVAVDAVAPAGERMDPIAREELAQLFNIERALDSGGLVTSYIAREVETERKVLLRALPRQPVREAGLEDKLLRELATAASLDHPHVVPLYRYGATPRYVWYSGKHVAGQSLAELLRSGGSLELHAALRLVEQLASALQYAHRRGVVHADVRPSNVRVDPNGWSLLTGFAVGRALDRLPLTVLGGRPLRRPEYLAPEERYSRQPGPAADQYSLAVLVYECLTGSLPFDGMSADDMVPPALTGPHPDIPEHVQLGLRRALSARPGDRYQSILEFVSVLESEASPRTSQPVDIARPSSGARLPPPRRSLPAPQRPSPVPPRQSPVPSAAGPAALGHRQPTNTTVLMGDQPGRWRRTVKWLAFVAFVVAGAFYGPALVPKVRGFVSDSATAAPPAQSGPPRMVERDSGVEALPAPPPAPVAAGSTTAAAAPPRTPVVTPARPAASPPRPATAAPQPARLFVNATPWGQVFIDGQLVGNTPQANLIVPAGSHRIRVAREGFQAFERVVQLAPAQELRLTDIVLQATGP